MALSNNSQAQNAVDPSYLDIEAKLDELLRRYDLVLSHYREAQERERAWQAEREQLLATQAAAERRIAVMIERLKQLEGDSQ